MAKRTVLPIVLAGIWIALSEFLRNEFFFKSAWEEHFAALGLKFETLPLNGVLWAVWSLLLAFFVFELLQKFSFRKTLFFSWLAAFVMMWIALFNLRVFPLNILLAAVPLSLVEVAVAALIIKRVREKNNFF
jgi:hypothetical protein